MGALAGGKSQADTRELGHATVQYPGRRETRDGSGHSAQHRGRTRSCDPSGPRGSRRQDGTLRSDSQSDSSPKRQEKINGAKISDEKRPPLHVRRSPEPTVGVWTVWTAAPRTTREGGERGPRPSARPARGALAQRASGEAGPAAPTDARTQQLGVHTFLHSFGGCLPSTCSVPSTVQGTRSTAVNKGQQKSLPKPQDRQTDAGRLQFSVGWSG